MAGTRHVSCPGLLAEAARLQVAAACVGEMYAPPLGQWVFFKSSFSLWMTADADGFVRGAVRRLMGEVGKA